MNQRVGESGWIERLDIQSAAARLRDEAHRMEFELQVDQATLLARAAISAAWQDVFEGGNGFLGLTEVADSLGVSKQRVAQLASDDPTMPEPVAKVGSGRRLWLRAHIDDFRATRESS